MRLLRILLAFLFFSAPLIFTSCYVKKAIVPGTEATITPLGDRLTVNDGSLVYALPMTLFNITVEFERTIEKPGPYAKFASELLGLRDVITAERESWLIRSIIVESLEEPDPSEYYVIESSTLFQTNALSLKRAGLILDLNPEMLKGEGARIGASEKVNQVLSYKDLGAREYYVSQSDTAYRLVKLDTTFVRIPYLVERRKPLTLEQLAERAAKTLLELREGKHLILTGEANVFPQSSAAIEEINKTERELTALFTGKTATEKKIIRYTYIPDRELAGKPHTLFRFSVNTGPGTNSSIPVTVEIEPAGKIKDLTYSQRPQSKDNKGVKVYDKIFYRPPEIVTMKLKYGNETLYESRKMIYQLGEVLQLPANYIIGK